MKTVLRISAVLSMMVATTGAMAQQVPQQPAFEPYTITAEQNKTLVDFALDIPTKYGAALIQQLNQLQQDARTKRMANEAKAKKE